MFVALCSEPPHDPQPVTKKKRGVNKRGLLQTLFPAHHHKVGRGNTPQNGKDRTCDGFNGRAEVRPCCRETICCITNSCFQFFYKNVLRGQVKDKVKQVGENWLWQRVSFWLLGLGPKEGTKMSHESTSLTTGSGQPFLRTLCQHLSYVNWLCCSPHPSTLGQAINNDELA